MIHNIVILVEKLLNGLCRIRMRPARLVSYAFLYTTDNASQKISNLTVVVQVHISISKNMMSPGHAQAMMRARLPCF